MKKFSSFAFAALLALAVVVSCKKEEEPAVVVRGVTVTPESVSLVAGESQALTAEILPSNATDKTVEWSSNKPEIATVSNEGVVTGVSGGICVITAKAGSKSGTCNVTVKGPATGITITPESVDLGYSETATVAVALAPEGYTTDTKVIWTNEKDDIVTITVDESNPFAVKVVAGKVKGSSKITAKTEDGKLSAVCTANVIGVSDKGLKTAAEVIAFLETADQLEATDDIKLAADIDFEGATLPSVVSFKASFNGQNFAFKNCKITDAIFASNEGSVKNLVIDKSCTLAPTTGEFAPIVLVNSGIVSGCVNNAPISYCENNEGYVLIAGIVAASKREGSLENCTNNGAIEITCGGSKTTAPIVAGVVGASAGFVRGCINTGDIHHEVGSAALGKGGLAGEMVVLGGINISHHTGGVIGLFFNNDRENKVPLTDRGIEGCKNTGNVTAIAPSGLDLVSNRPYVAGIAGAISSGYIKDCENTGKIFLNSDSGKGVGQSSDKQHFCAGIYCTNQNDFTIAAGCGYPACTNCINRGDITMTNDSTNGYQYVGGIASQCDMEAAASATGVQMKGCVNYGKILGNGYQKVRAAGICPGAGNYLECKNYGTVELGPNVVSNANSGSFIGNISCYHPGDKHPVVNCEAYGDLVMTAPKQMAGGFVGIFGSIPNAEISGKCVCKIIGPEGCYAGMLTGYCNAGDDWVAGTKDAPMYIGGSIIINDVETKLTKDNYLKYLIGWDKSEAGKHPTDFIVFTDK